MPNVQLSIYLPDEDYAKYVKHKDKLNANTRDFFLSAFSKVK